MTVLLLKLEEDLNLRVMSDDAMPDGATDNGPPFRAALAAAVADAPNRPGGATVKAPAGAYYIKLSDQAVELLQGD